jgi:predicted HAD superfamily Cof-like phosphohydrolase
MSPSNFALIQQFHAKFDPSADAYTDLLGRRRELLEEEIAEAFEAMAEFKRSGSRTDKAQVVKELCDVLYLTYGTLFLLGVDADAAFAEVHASNMSKTPQPGVKAQKGPDYKPAEMERFV